MTTFPEDDAAAREVMLKHGITRVPTAYYLFKDYRYTKLEDAVAQAERHERASRPS
jgi:hypothetical protein